MRKSVNNSALFFAFGVILILVCIVLLIIGNGMSRDNNFYVQQEYYYEHGVMDSTGSILAYIGFGLAVLGCVMIGIGLYVNHMFKRKFKIDKGSDFDEVDDMIVQMAGTATIFDTFHSEDKEKTFCFYRNKTCILKEGDQISRGKMDPLEWAGGHPTLWEITFGEGEETTKYRITKTEGNILVKGEQSEEIFYRE